MIFQKLGNHFIIVIFGMSLLLLIVSSIRAFVSSKNRFELATKDILKALFKRLSFVLLGAILAIPLFAISLSIYFEIPLLDTPIKIQKLIESIDSTNISKLRNEFWLCVAWALTPLSLALLYLFTPAKSTAYGRARWAEKSDIQKMGLNCERGFILARAWGKKIKYDTPLSTLVIAPPGTGKTSAIIIPNLLSIPNSQVVIDVKGEICSLTAGYRQKKLLNQVFIFNPFGEDSNFHFNPFNLERMSKLGFAEKTAIVRQVGSTIFPKPKDEKDSHWRETAKTFFEFAAMHNIEKYGYTTLYEIYRFPKKDWTEELEDKYFDEKKKREELGEEVNTFRLLLRQIAENETLHDNIRDDARRFLGTPPNEFGSVLSTFSTKMSIFGDLRVKELTDKNSFMPERLREDNITLYIKCLEKDIPSLSPIIRILLETIVKELMSRESTDPKERIYLELDEVMRFGELDFMIELPSISRSYNLPNIFAAQSYAQIRKHYSQEDLEIMLDTVAYQVVFRANRQQAAEDISKEIGDFTAHKKTTSSQDIKILQSYSTSEEAKRLVTAQDILNIPKDKVLILATGHKATPIFAQANFYFKDRTERQKTKIKKENK